MKIGSDYFKSYKNVFFFIIKLRIISIYLSIYQSQVAHICPCFHFRYISISVYLTFLNRYTDLLMVLYNLHTFNNVKITCRQQRVKFKLKDCPYIYQDCPYISPVMPRRQTAESIGQQDTLCNGYRHRFPKLLRRPSGGYRFNPDCRRATIQEYLTLVPSYG